MKENIAIAVLKLLIGYLLSSFDPHMPSDLSIGLDCGKVLDFMYTLMHIELFTASLIQ